MYNETHTDLLIDWCANHTTDSFHNQCTQQFNSTRHNLEKRVQQLK